MATATPVERARNALQKGSTDEIRNALAGIGGLLEALVPAELPAKTPLPREVIAALEVLGESLGHSSWHVRRLAASILIESGEIGLPVLARLVESGNLDQVYWSCFVASRLGPRAGPLLAKAVSSQNREHRLYAIHALGRRKEIDAIATLVHALDDPVWSMRKRAADALASRADRDKVVEALREEVTRGNRNRIFWGIRVMSRVLGEKALPILKTLITWKDDDLRYLGIVALGKLKSPEVAQLLVGYLSDASQVVREKAVELLAAHGEAARTPLLEIANSAPAETRFWALKALWRITPDEFYLRCQSLLASPQAELRYVAVRALALAPAAQAVPLLIACFQDPLWVLRKFASDQIVRMGEAAISPLYRGMTEGNEDAQYWSITTLAHLGRPALACLREAMTGGDRTARGFAISAVADALVSEEAVGLLCEAFADEHWPIRKQAAETVRGQGARAIPFLIEGAIASDANRRYWSRKVLGEVAGPELPALIEALGRFPHATQERIARALAALSTDELARVALLDPDQAVAALKDKGAEAGEVAAPPPSAPQVTILPPVSDDPLTYLVRLVHLVQEGRGVEAYLRAGISPVVRVDEQLIRTEAPALSVKDISRIIEAIAPGVKPGGGAVEVGFDLGVVGRCRARLFHESRGPVVVLRPLGLQAPRLRDVGDQESLEPLTRLRTGLVLISGPPVSGRSWTAHALVDAVNAERGVHVATVEQPVEHLHAPRAGLVTQLAVPGDASTFDEGLRMALEGDARVVYLSDVPDGETALRALEAAATTTLVIATLRDLGAVRAMRRMLELVGPAARERAQQLLAAGLRASISQVLLPHVTGKGTVIAREIVLGVPNVLHPLAQGRFSEIEKLIAEAPPEGLRSFAAALRLLVARGLISQTTAREAAPVRAAATELRVMEGRGA